MNKRSISDVFLFFQVFVFAAAVPPLLRLKMPRLKALLELGIHSSAGRDRVEKISAYVEIAIRKGGPLVRSGCLTRGVTRYYFFRRDGMDVSLCFGMGQVNGQFVGHCWLLKAGEPFMEALDPRPRARVGYSSDEDLTEFIELSGDPTLWSVRLSLSS